MKWFEEYRCGCVSPVVCKKRLLPGYCPRHGENRRYVYPYTSDGGYLFECPYLSKVVALEKARENREAKK